MDAANLFLPLFAIAAFYVLLFWLLFRAVRAIERIADKIEKIADNENARE